MSSRTRGAASPPAGAKKVSKTPARSTKGKGTRGKSQDDVPPVHFEGGVLSVLKDANLLDVFTFLTPSEAVKWSLTNRTFATFFASKTADQLWRALMSSSLVDKYAEYKDKVSASHRAQMEASFSCRRVVSALMSTSCSQCGGYAESLCVMTCTRVCSSCWECSGVGPQGIVVQPLSLCTASYAKTHYLLSDKDIKSGLFCLEVDDANKCHGLASPKVTIVLESGARKLAEEKFKDVEGGLAAEKTSRADKAKKKWEQRKAAAAKGGINQSKEPDSVRKEREKDEGKPTWRNYIAGNQAYIVARSSAAMYGFYCFVCTRSPSEMLTAPPSVFVTRDSPEQVMTKHPHVTQALLDAGACKILVNLIQAVHEVSKGGTILVDMYCNLVQQAAQVNEVVRGRLVGGAGMDVGGTPQAGCLILFRGVKILGTPRGRITSRRVAFWTDRDVAIVLEGLRISVESGGVNAPALVLTGHSVVTECTISTDSDEAFSLLLHGQSCELVDNTIRSMGSTLTAHVDRLSHLVVRGNDFERLRGANDLGFFFDAAPTHGERPAFTPDQQRAFARQLDEDNTEDFLGQCAECGEFHD